MNSCEMKRRSTMIMVRCNESICEDAEAMNDIEEKMEYYKQGIYLNGTRLCWNED